MSTGSDGVQLGRPGEQVGVAAGADDQPAAAADPLGQGPGADRGRCTRPVAKSRSLVDRMTTSAAVVAEPTVGNSGTRVRATCDGRRPLGVVVGRPWSGRGSASPRSPGRRRAEGQDRPWFGSEPAGVLAPFRRRGGTVDGTAPCRRRSRRGREVAVPAAGAGVGDDVDLAGTASSNGGHGDGVGWAVSSQSGVSTIRTAGPSLRRVVLAAVGRST